jgi:hypothetical protein
MVLMAQLIDFGFSLSDVRGMTDDQLTLWALAAGAVRKQQA